MTRAVALLDKPSPDAFGMNPVVVDDEGIIRIAGLAPASEHRGRGIVSAEVKDLVRGGHALQLEHEEIQGEFQQDMVALWVGDAFSKKAELLDLAPPPLPALARTAAGGRFFLGPAAEMYPYLDRWTIAAFRRFCSLLEDPNAQRAIASLMQWVLPERPETMAAVWKSSRDQARALEFQLRTFARGKTPDVLEREHDKRLSASHDRLDDLRIVVFTGHTGVDHNLVAKRFADNFAAGALGSFSESVADHYVRTRLEHLTKPEKKVLLMQHGQAKVDRSPLALALATLDSTKREQNVVVLDSLRHRKIRETLKWFRPKKLVVVAVTVEADELLGRVQAKWPDPAWILRHPTEEEIPLLAREADKQVKETVADRELAEIYEASQA